MADRPDKQTIQSWVQAIGGDLSTLSYSKPVQGVSGEGGTPQPIQVLNYSGLWGQFWWQIAQDKKYSLREFYDDIRGDDNNRALPQNWRIGIPLTGPNKAKMYRDQIFTGDPQFDIKFPSLKGDKRERLERQWSSYLNQEIQREEQASDQSPIDIMKQHCCDYGASSRYDVLDLTRWPKRPRKRPSETMEDFDVRMQDYEAQRRAISPFVVRAVDPMNFAYDLTTNPPQWAMIREPIFPWDAAERFPSWQSDMSTTPTPGASPAVKVEWWTPEWHAVYINGQPAIGPKEGADDQGVAPNKYGHIPIVFAAGGMGEGDVSNRPEVLLQGLYRRMRVMLLEDAIIFNIWGMYERNISFGPKKVLVGPDTDIDGERADAIEADLMAGSYQVARMPIGWRIETLDPPQMPQALVTRWEQVKADIDAATAYDVAAGAPQSGPAYKMQLQLGQVDKRTSTDVLHMQQALETWAINRLRTLKTLLRHEKVGANVADKPGTATQWQDLDPSEIPDQIECTCDLTTDSEAEKARLEQAGLALLGANQIGPLDFWRDYMKDDDPEGKVAGVLMWQMVQTVGLPALNQLAQQGWQGMLQGVSNASGLVPGGQNNAGGAPAGNGTGSNPGNFNVGPQGAALGGEQTPSSLTPPNPAQGLQNGTSSPLRPLPSVATVTGNA